MSPIRTRKPSTPNLPSVLPRKNIFAKRKAPLRRFHQYRVFGDAAERLGRVLRKAPSETTTVSIKERLFVLPGRQDVVVKLLEGDTFSMRHCVEAAEGLELWEETAHNRLPLPRSISAMVASHIPHMRAALSSFRNPDALTKGLKRKAKIFDADTHIERSVHDGVKVMITTQDFGDKDAYSVTLRSRDEVSLRDALAKLPVHARNRNIGEFLLSA